MNGAADGKESQGSQNRSGERVLNRDLGNWFKEKGIVHTTAAGYTPKQNGTAERLKKALERESDACGRRLSGGAVG